MNSKRMKRASRPTRMQKERIAAAGYRPENWLVQGYDENAMTLVNKRSGKRRVILC